MKLRVARHTTNLQLVINFYTTVLGLEIIGEFKDHNDYDGVFIGGKNIGWQLEFTVSKEQPDHHPDEDDLLVFYVDSPGQFDIIKKNITALNIKWAEPKNPYWKENGITIVDPDGFRIVIALNKA